MLEQLEIEREETEEYNKRLQQAREKFIFNGSINEGDMPISEIAEFRTIVLNFLDDKIAIGEDLKRDVETSINFYQ